MKLIDNLKTKIDKARINRIRRKLMKYEYILNTSKAQKKEDRKAHKALKRATRLKKIADWKPFNWGCIRKMAHRNYLKNGQVAASVAE